jgi:hypothetical protein
MVVRAVALCRGRSDDCGYRFGLGAARAMSETGVQVEGRDGEIFVMRADLLFIATYYKRANEPQLILRRRMRCSLKLFRQQSPL